MGNVIEIFDCMKLRCNQCGEEKYEINIDVKDGYYTCKCGSHTFTPLGEYLD